MSVLQFATHSAMLTDLLFNPAQPTRTTTEEQIRIGMNREEEKQAFYQLW